MLESNEPYDTSLIAPCGMNCGICLAHLRNTNGCNGCRINYGPKRPHCSTCRIMNCEILMKTESGFCYDCQKYHCIRLKNLDKRYRLKYNMSMIENLDAIKSIGLELFVQNEKTRWLCPTCGGMICVHTGYCFKCSKI